MNGAADIATGVAGDAANTSMLAIGDTELNIET